MPSSFYAQVLPIVVLYQQDIDQSLTFSSLNDNLYALGITMDVFVYDNSPVKQYDQDYFTWENFRVHYFHDPLNSGLSKAYNTGFNKALSLQKDWLLLLDQDTTFRADYLQANQTAVSQHPDISLFAPLLKLKNDVLFSPCIAKHKRGYPPGPLSPGLFSLWKYSPVNSGMLIRTSLFQQAGGYNEKVKIDFADFQFLEKVRLTDARFYLIKAVALQDYSSFEYSIVKQRKRFLQYLDDAWNSDKPNLSDKLGFLYTVSRHAAGLSIKMRSLSFIGLFIQKYLIR